MVQRVAAELGWYSELAVTKDSKRSLDRGGSMTRTSASIKDIIKYYIAI